MSQQIGRHTSWHTYVGSWQYNEDGDDEDVDTVIQINHLQLVQALQVQWTGIGKRENR